MLQRRPRSRAAHPRAADTGRPTHRRHCAGVRGRQRPRQVTLRSGAGVVRRQPRGRAQGLCAAGGQEHDEPAGTCPRRGGDRYHKIGCDREARQDVFVDVFLDAHGRGTTPPTIPCTATKGRFFHGYYDCWCYLPLYVFCRQLLAAKLRRSNIDAAAGAKDEVARLVARIRRRWPEVRILLAPTSAAPARS